VSVVVINLEAADPARDLFLAAVAREQAIRTTLAHDHVPATVAGDARAVVTAYQALVRLHPASGYADNALWQAGCLSIDVFLRFGQPQDKNTGVRLLRALASGDPASKLVRQVPDQLARVDPATPSPERAANGPQTVPISKLATITAIRRTVLSDAVRVIIEFDNEVTFHDERIANPLRVFVDLSSTRPAPALLDRTLHFDGDDIVRQIRIGRHPNHTTRVVLDAAGVSSYSVYPRYHPYRLVIDCVRGSEPPIVAPALTTRKLASDWTSGLPAASPPSPRGTDLIMDAMASIPTPALTGRTLPFDWTRGLPSAAAQATSLLSDRMASERPAPLPDAAALLPEALPGTVSGVSTVSPGAPLKNLTGRYSIARQLGLSVSRIVIDPGHGGHDPGAKGKSIDEAELVLDVALRVEKLLQQVPGTEVILTRRTDEFVPLQERTAIANREGADLFLSIHANASANAAARGVETYFLNFASNLSAASVAARENAASGQSMGALPDFVKAIALNNKLDESRDFATEVQRSMVERLRGGNKTLKDLGVKQAPFVVLIGAAMPSVLAEISFVTNTQEARLLHSSAYRQRIAEALFNATRKYQISLQRVATVAHQ